jgi:chemotaxis signal transduction protein
VVPAAKVVALPQTLDGQGAITGAIELRSDLVPVARFADQKDSGQLGAYVIFRGASGQMALGAERVERLIALRPDQISRAPGKLDQFEGVAVLDEAGDLLRLLAPDRIGLDG